MAARLTSQPVIPIKVGNSHVYACGYIFDFIGNGSDVHRTSLISRLESGSEANIELHFKAFDSGTNNLLYIQTTL